MVFAAVSNAGLEGEGVSNFSQRALRSVERLARQSLGIWSSTDEMANRSTQTMGMNHSDMASSFG